MAGRNFLFVPGPTNLPDRVMRAMMVAMEDHRSSIFPELTRACLNGLKPIFKTGSGTPVPEHAFAMILALRRNLLAYRQDIENGVWNRSRFSPNPT